ncbi:ABC transporter permease [Aquihabitans sp. McL0605]|uniref:ABC transporter permease n=1 Tax=Aquihabitans sp. McL0605 TaxID=3415671 RepID=UPI003CEAC2EF
MFLAVRDLRVGRARFVLVGVVIALVGLLTTLLSGLAAGLVDDGISGLRGLPLTHLALQPGAESSFSRSTLRADALGPWRDVKGAEAAPLGVSFFNAKTAEGATLDLAVFGTPPDSFLAPSAEARAALAGRPGIVLSQELRKEGVRVGDVLTVVGPDVELPVLGFTYTGSYGHVDIAFTSLEVWQHLVYGDNADGRFSAVAVRGGSASAHAAADAAAGTVTETKAHAYAGSPGYAAETATMTLIRVFLLAISALVVGAFFTVWTIQRTRQIGLMKALGASNAYVLRDALGQLAIVLVLATSVGAAIAMAVGRLIGDAVPFSLQLGPAVASSVTLIVLGLAGSLVAIRRVTSVDPIIALGAEP